MCSVRSGRVRERIDVVVSRDPIRKLLVDLAADGGEIDHDHSRKQTREQAYNYASLFPLHHKRDVQEGRAHLLELNTHLMHHPTQPLNTVVVLALTKDLSGLEPAEVTVSIESVLPVPAIARLDEVRLIPVLDLPIRDPDERGDLFRCEE